jgi:hypothetical protein
VCGREYVQAETGLDAETFDGRYDVCSMDMEPITGANYKSFLPSETAPVIAPGCCGHSDTLLPARLKCMALTLCVTARARAMRSWCANPSTMSSASR